MTTTYDPFHPKYLIEGDLREELTRVYDLCHGCRLCFKFCTSFPTLFKFIDALPDQDSARLTPAQQDQVVDECFQCKLCYVNCPYTPDNHEWALDFPRLMMRAEQVLRKKRRRGLKDRLTDSALARTDLIGTVNSAAAPLVNAVMAKPSSMPRKVVETMVGVSHQRVLPPYAKQRFSTWFKKRAAAAGGPRPTRSRAQTVVLFPTCLVEYQDVGVGHDMVKVLERNGVDASLPEGLQCCGAPYLHQGDVDGFRAKARHNIEVLAGALRESPEATVVVPQPTCGYILKKDYVDYVAGADAELVASRTKDLCEYLVDLHKSASGPLDIQFTGSIPQTVTYHAPCHLRAQNVGLKSRDLVKLTGTKITVVAECSGVDGTWGLRAENIDIARGVARKMRDAMARAGSEVVMGDCSLANGGIALETGAVPQHPIQVLARAYGIAEEPIAIRLRERTRASTDAAREAKA
jgi:glycerol-3-phosphate dehydrogenase subunit C